MSDFEFKLKAKWEGIAYKKVAAAIAEFPEKITNAQQMKDTKGVGQASALKIQEFLQAGKIERLERYRRGDFSAGAAGEN